MPRAVPLSRLTDSFLDGTSSVYLEELQRAWEADPNSVDESWDNFFRNFVGQAAATAAVLLAGGAAGKRQILPHGRVVIHAPAAEGRGAIPDLVLEADEIERVRLMLEGILASHTGRSAEQVREDTERDLILNAHRALAYGVVDTVLMNRDSAADPEATL